MARAQVEMSPVNGEISNDVSGEMRVISPSKGGTIIVTDEASISKLLEKNTRENFHSGQHLKVFKLGQRINGILGDISLSDKAPYYRIPSMLMTKKGRLVIVADYRSSGADQVAVEIAYGLSENGGIDLEYGKAVSRDVTSSGFDLNLSRVMDSTFLYDKDNGEDGTLYLLAGEWINGTQNWQNHADSDNTTKRYWKNAVMAKFDPSSKQWSQTPLNLVNSDGAADNLKGLVGGVGQGIKMSNGEYIMPVQYTESAAGYKAGVIVTNNPDNGWTFIRNEISMSEWSIFELRPGLLIGMGRMGTGTKAYQSSDFGRTWSVFAPFNDKITQETGDCEGSYISFTTLAGKTVVIGSRPQNTDRADLGVDSQYGRNQITLYYLSENAQKAIPLDVLQYLPGVDSNGERRDTVYGGYSSLYYYQGIDGEKLFVAYEDEGGISVQDISYLIPTLNQLVDKYDTTSALSPEQIEDIKTQVISEAKPEISTSVMEEVDRKLSDWPRDFYCFAKTVSVEGTTCPVISSDGSTLGELTASGGYLTDGTINTAKLRPSELYKGLLHFTTTNAVHGFRGDFAFDTSAEVVSILFGLYIPTQTGQSSWFPIFKLNSDSSALSGWSGGLNYDYGTNKFEIMPCGTTDALSSDAFSRDKLHTIVLEYTNSNAKMYVDGNLVSTKTMSQSQFTSFKSSISLALGGDGASKVFDYHAGAFGVYNRVLTDKEKKYGWMFNGDSTSRNLIDFTYELNKSFEKENKYLKEELAALSSLTRPIISSNSSIPQASSLVVNMTPELFSRGKVCNSTLTKTGITPEYSDMVLLVDGNENNIRNTFGVSKTGGWTSGERGYNPSNGYFYVGKDLWSTALKLKDYNISTSRGFSIEIQYMIKENITTAWSCPLCISGIELETSKGNGYRTGENIRLEYTATDAGGDIKFYSGSEVGLPSGGDAASFGASPGIDGMVKMVITISSGNEFKVYKDYNSTPVETKSLSGPINQIKYLLFNRGGNQAGTKCSNIEYYKIRIWKDTVLSGTEVEQLANF